MQSSPTLTPLVTGIILFELFAQFSTEMERRESIHLLKQQQLPPSFMQRYPFVSVLSLNMTAHDPTLRPSLPELTRGELASFTSDLVARPADGFKLMKTFSDGRQLQCITPVLGATCGADATTKHVPSTLAEARVVIARLEALVAQQREELSRLRTSK